MSDGTGFGGMPSFAGGGAGLSPSIQEWLQMQQLAQAQGQAQAPGQMMAQPPQLAQDVPQATPPGFSGFNPQTPPTGAPTDVVRPEAQGLASAAMNALGPSSAQAATPDPNDIRGRFISTLQQGGLTNPNGLGAVAAYAQHESRYSPSNITGSWSDPSESGQAGQSGGILSWRADRLANMKAFTQGAADPVVAQAQFTLAENPALIRALQNAQSPQEANALMADAWKFAGYNRPGGENAARLATTQAYANSFGGGGQALPAVATPRGGGSMGSTAQQGSFGLGGVVGQGSAVPGQASAMPGVASLSAQPLAVAPPPTGFSTDPAEQQPSNQYAQIGNALKAVAASQQKQGQKGGGGVPGAPEVGGRPISLQQARAMFDPGKFYEMLRNAGVGGQARGS
ncbi:hypothetical protein [Methylobacterium pseudosasicola]|uniref:Phage tail lysozyme domain-containing protein n=1 Tax=Methylobacterium pseudosasicola TaxID=582667 RepID=A0A1I4VQJ2_9HYPH|nr:hypothetical protein [Methylobacterium pseudosasicola]SFN03450.1 hypothetical protein SAMN05192568_11162 [Methylobacterium pseudosasicola]